MVKSVAKNGENGFKNVFHSRLYYFDLLQNGNSNFGLIIPEDYPNLRI